MALITSAEIKAILGITGSEKDAQLTAIVPLLPGLVTGYCNDLFLNKNLSYTASTFSFLGHTITDSEEGFVDAGFQAGLDIYVSGSDSNDYLYTLSTVSASKVVTTSETPTSRSFTTEDSGNGITVYNVQYPEDIKIPVAYLTNDIMVNNTGVKSEKIGDYSVSFLAQMSGLTKQLFTHYRRPHFR